MAKRRVGSARIRTTNKTTIIRPLTVHIVFVLMATALKTEKTDVQSCQCEKGYCCENENKQIFLAFCWQNRLQVEHLGEIESTVDWKLSNYTNHYPWYCHDCFIGRDWWRGAGYEIDEELYLKENDDVQCPQSVQLELGFPAYFIR